LKQQETAKVPKVAAKKQGRGRLAFIGETFSELRKVIWPPRRDVLRLTIVVIIVCIIAGVILGGVDYGFYKLIRHFLIG
jgi:preprotein translocase SecE subunit